MHTLLVCKPMHGADAALDESHIGIITFFIVFDILRYVKDRPLDVDFICKFVGLVGDI